MGSAWRGSARRLGRRRMVRGRGCRQEVKGFHAGDCGCEPCQMVRAVISALSKQPGLNWMMENHASRI